MPITHTGNPSTFYDDVDYPADLEDADEASITPLEKIQDNTSYLKAELEDDLTGLGAINNRVDALAALNFPFDYFPTYLYIGTVIASPKHFVIYDFSYSKNLGIYIVLLWENSSSSPRILYSTDLHEWTEDATGAVFAFPPSNLIAGSSSGGVTATGFIYDTTNLKIFKYSIVSGYTITATALASGSNIKSNVHGGIFFQGVFIWGMYDALNNAIIVTSTNGTSVSRQAFGTTGDLNHIRGPMVMASDTAETIMVGIGNAPENPIVQNQSFFITSTDGITFSEHTFPAQNPGKEIFGGVCWNDEQSCFFAVSSDSVSFAMNLYKSTDGTTWTFVSTVATPGAPALFLNWQAVGIASVNNSVLVSIVPTTGLGGNHYFVYSADLGATWKCDTQRKYVPANVTAPALNAKLRGRAGQYVFGNTGHVMGSIVVGEQGTAVT